ncbi:SWI/SNF chromatin-remodeling complex subunit [Agyrium rufum]|nr:SWI/SNF chromatin-remodeling complex subunit [Agyrium rufum]
MPSPQPTATLKTQAQPLESSKPVPSSDRLDVEQSAAQSMGGLLANGAQTGGTNGVKSSGQNIEELKRKVKSEMASSRQTTGGTANGMGGMKTLQNGTSAPAEQPPSTATLTPGRKRSPSGRPIVREERKPTTSTRTKEMAQKVLLEQYVQRDQIHSAAMIVDKFQLNDIIRAKAAQKDEYVKLLQERKTHPGAIFGEGYAGFGNGVTNAPMGPHRIIFPSQRKRLGGRRTKELRLTRKDMVTQAEQFDELVPIRLDVEWDKIRLRDTFTWNIHDRVVPVRLFAEQLVEDFGLPLDQCMPLIDRVHASLMEQISEYHPQIFIDENPLDPHLAYNAYKDDEMRITIKLNITIGKYTLVDQFEWGINNPMNLAEEFARQMTQELSISGEFTTAIAHSIREQCQLYTRSLYITGHPFDGRPIEDQELKDSFLPSPMPSSFRPFQAAKEYTPYLYELNEVELEKTELSLSREERRQKRSVNRRGGPALPDLKDRRSTIRTLVVSSVLPGAATSLDDSRIFKRIAPVPGKGRRPGAGAKDGIDDSDDSQSEDSSPDSPAIPAHLLAGGTRTRNPRGAASAAQAAMRANLGRSLTPELSSLHHHETRTSGRKVGRDMRDDSPDDGPVSLIVKLRIPKDKFARFLRSLNSKSKGDSLKPPPPGGGPPSRSPSAGPPKLPPKPQEPSSSKATQQTSISPGAQTSQTPQSTGEPTTDLPSTAAQQEPLEAQEAVLNQDSPAKSSTKVPGPAMMFGRVDADGPPGPNHPIPPPPEFLISALDKLQQSYPDDRFEGSMRFSALSTTTGTSVTLRPDAPAPPDTQFCYLPRIRCLDCPGKLYTPGPGMGVDNFEVHLKNRHHREKVQRRVDGA